MKACTAPFIGRLGGWYDHEPPVILSKPQDDYQYSFRVPSCRLRLYPTGLHYQQPARFRQYSPLHRVQRQHPAGLLNFADARATSDLTAFFDLTKAPRPQLKVSAPKAANFFLHDRRKATDPDDQ